MTTYNEETTARTKLYLASRYQENAVIKSKDHPEFGMRYRRIKACRGHKKAIIAVCRMLLTAIRNVLAKDAPYSPDGFSVPHPSFVSKPLTKSQGLALLREMGYLIKEDTPIFA